MSKCALARGRDIYGYVRDNYRTWRQGTVVHEHLPSPAGGCSFYQQIVKLHQNCNNAQVVKKFVLNTF